MNLDSLSFALSQISYSVANLTKKNSKSGVQELSHLVTQHGLEADRHLLRSIFSHVDFSGDGKNNGKDFHQSQFLVQECASLIAKPNFISTVCYAVDHPSHHQKSLKPSAHLISHLTKVLKLNKVQEIAFGVALLHSSNSEISLYATQFLKNKLPELLKSFNEQDIGPEQEENLWQLLPEVIHLILTHTSKDRFGISVEQKEAFTKVLQKGYPRRGTPVVLVPLIYSDKPDIPMEKLLQEPTNLEKNMVESSMPEMIQELGYNFCASLEECRSNLLQLGVRELSSLTVARVIGMMCRTHVGLGDQISIQSLQNSSSIWNDNKEKIDSGQATTWNVEIFVQAAQELSPQLNWKEVIFNMDHTGFVIKDRLGLILLTKALKLGLGHEIFPVDLLFRLWHNTEGQLSYLQQILKNSDVFCFAESSTMNINIDALKSQPEDENRDIANWKCLGLIEVLMSLADAGLYQQVQELFKFPVNNCSDILVLGLIQLNQPINVMRQDLLTTVMPIFLGNHPNSASILQCAWHSQVHTSAIRNIVMNVMTDWYLRGDHDQTRLSRILDVAQDLKALSLLLNALSFPFVIDLACLASRREYLKLDKWLNDKIREHGEAFIQECVNFLKRRCPQLMGTNVPEDSLPKIVQLPPETLTTMLGCLQACTGNVNSELSETIINMASNCNALFSKSRQPLSVVKQPRSLDHVFNTLPLVSTQIVDPLSSVIPGINVGAPPNTSFALPNSIGIPNPGSPAKLFPNPTANPQSSFANIVPPLSSNLPGSTNSMLTSAFGSVGSKGPYMPQPNSGRQPTDIHTLFPKVSQVDMTTIEEEANGYFKRIYSHTLSIDEVLDMLKRFQESSNLREQDVFNCMMRSLYEEYKFFHQYPDKELYITAQLFGGIIERGLITYMSLGLALKYVLDALRKQSGSKMFQFGIAALDRFRTRLKDYPQYSNYLATIQHFHEFPPHLIEYIEYGARSQEPPNKPQGPVTTVGKTLSTTASTTTTVAKITPNLAHNGKPSIANATNIDTLLVATESEDKQILTPPEAIQDKVAFIFNNLSQANIVQKTDEIKEVVTEEYWPWVSQYLVMKRASIEPNFHTLYSNFLDSLKYSNLSKIVVNETFRNIKVLLRSDKSMDNFSDRSLLKNLGHWLGIITLSKNKPILQLEIDIKSLLIETYHKGQQELLYVVPFVGKVMESCAKSKVFKPPNPWTMGIMNLLAELHQEPDLKLNLKFEIEVLCKTLNIDIKDLKPGTLMKDTNRLTRIGLQLSQSPKKREFQPAPGPITEENIMIPISTMGPSNNQNLMSSVPVPPPVVPVGQPEPRFTFDDVNVSSLGGISNHIVINNQISLFQTQPQLKSFIRPSIERAIQEWLHIVVERSIKIALTTCEQIVKKDFALDPDEVRIRFAAHYMVRNLTAGMAMITCKDHLLISIANNLKSAFTTAMRGAVPSKEIFEQPANIIAQDNVELACAFIQRTAVEKALPELDKRLATEYEVRKHARSEGRRYCDPTVLTYQAERMPEQIRLKVGGVTPQQLSVYEEFARNIPGFLPGGERDLTGFVLKPPTNFVSVPDDIGQIYEKIASDLELHINHCMAPPTNPKVAALSNLLDAVMVARSSRDVGSALSLLQKAMEGLFECHILPMDSDLTSKCRSGHLLVLKALQDHRAYGPQWTNKNITRCLIDCREDYKYNWDTVECLIRNQLINMPQYDLYLAGAIDSGSYLAIQFAMQLVKVFVIDEHSYVIENDIMKIMEALMRVQMCSIKPPEGLSQLLEIVRASSEPLMDRAPGGSTSMAHFAPPRQFDDPPGLQEKTEFLLREWVNLHHSATSINASFTKFVQQMNLHGILKTDDLITRFFRLCVEMCVDMCYRNLSEQNASQTLIRAKCFHTLDAFARLISLLVKHSGESANTATKINLLTKVLSIVSNVLLQDHEIRHADFQQLPYHRIYIMLLLELNVPDQIMEMINFQVLNAFCNSFHTLNPAKAPGFAYAWLDLISHRVFLGRMLAVTGQQKGWGIYSKLLIDLFKFLTPFLRNTELSKPVSLLYKGTLRLLLVLLHDFPEFLCDYHYGFCDVIPPNCIQMRNLILSAFPRNMRLPDPFTPNLKVDLLPEIAHAPRIPNDFQNVIQPASFKKDLDSYIKTRSPVTFLSDLRSHLQLSSEPGIRYNIPLINALVLYVGTQAISYINNKGLTPNMGTITHSSHMDVFQNLAVDLDTEGRYLFLNAIANQLRYPNSHTHYFSCTLLYLFVEANTEAIQEQITRVLLERLIVNRPHPWGLLITFIELIKNQHFKFWNHEFVRCAPEIEKLFDSVARSCMVQRQPAVSREQETSAIANSLMFITDQL